MFHSSGWENSFCIHRTWESPAGGRGGSVSINLKLFPAAFLWAHTAPLCAQFRTFHVAWLSKSGGLLGASGFISSSRLSLIVLRVVLQLPLQFTPDFIWHSIKCRPSGSQVKSSESCANTQLSPSPSLVLVSPSGHLLSLRFILPLYLNKISAYIHLCEGILFAALFQCVVKLQWRGRGFLHRLLFTQLLLATSQRDNFLARGEMGLGP